MTQENSSTTHSFVCDDSVSAVESSTDNITWLNKICTELGYHNLAFFAKYKASQAVPAGSKAISDAVDGCNGVTGHKIIKAVIGIILEHLVDR